MENLCWWFIGCTVTSGLAGMAAALDSSFKQELKWHPYGSLALIVFAWPLFILWLSIKLMFTLGFTLVNLLLGKE